MFALYRHWNSNSLEGLRYTVSVAIYGMYTYCSVRAKSTASGPGRIKTRLRVNVQLLQLLQKRNVPTECLPFYCNIMETRGSGAGGLFHLEVFAYQVHVCRAGSSGSHDRKSRVSREAHVDTTCVYEPVEKRTPACAPEEGGMLQVCQGSYGDGLWAPGAVVVDVCSGAGVASQRRGRQPL